MRYIHKSSVLVPLKLDFKIITCWVRKKNTFKKQNKNNDFIKGLPNLVQLTNYSNSLILVQIKSHVFP